MTLREQIGQLFMMGFTGTTVSKDLASFMKAYTPGGAIFFRRNLESVQQIVDLTNGLQKLSPASPLLIAIDQEGGRVSRLPAEFTIFPPCAQLGQCNSSELAYSAAATIAKELRAVGINMNMAPVLDVNSNPENPVIGDRAFGADPDLVAELGQATIGGLQDNLVVACGKHFPGHGDTSTDSHKELPVVDAGLQRLRDTEFPPFQQAIRFGVASLMTAHVLYRVLDPDAPATLSPAVIQRLLREEFRYDGVVFTDDLEMHAIIDHDGIGEAAVRSFVAGCDVLLICKDQDRVQTAMEAMERAVRDGRITQERLEQSLARVARLKSRYLSPYKPVTISDARLVVGCRTHKMLLDSWHKAYARVPVPTSTEHHRVAAAPDSPVTHV
ncbi:MAG: beta-N-acetylhexosaminidase [Nitrospira sp.]|nr:beta-N-acetylhexosaminidase [Nitrospira sp.]MCW5786862.1 beta-N-acetylhexosaminidase [Nitrospira sp.]MDR4473296.1 beta-N-acetylhexosaminidase [Nitrospira sp.]MDR4474840.1 beta-N-acetylhexosaminidase [Nitrospira sp.]HAP41080.1 beta-N-acetylhexosaminidase [Nitrospira sp.]